jgi:hypothetical protein
MDKIESKIEDRGAEAVNRIINVLRHEEIVDTNKISDGYHTFGELYEHRITLFIELCKWIHTLSFYYAEISKFLDYEPRKVWKSKFHSDGSTFEGWFVMGIGTEKGSQITYHLPNEKWEECKFAETFSKAPEFDGHTSTDVLERLKTL